MSKSKQEVICLELNDLRNVAIFAPRSIEGRNFPRLVADSDALEPQSRRGHELISIFKVRIDLGDITEFFALIGPAAVHDNLSRYDFQIVTDQPDNGDQSLVGACYHSLWHA